MAALKVVFLTTFVEAIVGNFVKITFPFQCWVIVGECALSAKHLTSGRVCHRGLVRCPGPWFNIKMLSYQYRKSHCGDKTVVRSSYLHNGISYTGKMTSLYWIGAQAFPMPIRCKVNTCSWLWFTGLVGKSYANYHWCTCIRWPATRPLWRALQ